MASVDFRVLSSPTRSNNGSYALTVRGEGLSLRDIILVARERLSVRLPDDRAALQKVADSRTFIDGAVDRGEAIYGVTTLFGGMANVAVPKAAAAALQNNLPLSHKTGVGRFLSNEDVRSAMLLRANALLRGASGVRLELIRRLTLFLNLNVTPRIHCHGSIGASGDLVPLAYVTGSICGLAPGFRVDYDGEETDALTALDRMKLPRLRLEAKEALALMNGTSVMSGVAATCTADGLQMLAMAVCTTPCSCRRYRVLANRFTRSFIATNRTRARAGLRVRCSR